MSAGPRRAASAGPDAEVRIDEAFAHLRENVVAYADLFGEERDDALGIRMQIEEVGIDTPIELDVRVDAAGRVAIGCAPPLYRLETGVMPVFHQVRITLVPDPADAPAGEA